MIRILNLWPKLEKNCDQNNDKSMTILYQKVTMANTILWRYKLVFYDDSKKDDVSCHIIDDVTATAAATSLLMSAPRQMQMPLTGDYDEKWSSQNH
jgi:DNA-binding LacI/PurR family transcriptional regulator